MYRTVINNDTVRPLFNFIGILILDKRFEFKYHPRSWKWELRLNCPTFSSVLCSLWYKYHYVNPVRNDTDEFRVSGETGRERERRDYLLSLVFPSFASLTVQTFTNDWLLSTWITKSFHLSQRCNVTNCWRCCKMCHLHRNSSFSMFNPHAYKHVPILFPTKFGNCQLESNFNMGPLWHSALYKYKIKYILMKTYRELRKWRMVLLPAKKRATL